MKIIIKDLGSDDNFIDLNGLKSVHINKIYFNVYLIMFQPK